MNRTIRYFLMNPTENRTVLVETPTPAAMQPAVAAKLMEAEPTAEQVGFLGSSETADIALRMAGGEFCANATMSAAVVHTMRTERTCGIVTVEVSGAKEPVEVAVTAGDGLWEGIVHMPRPNAVETVRFADGQTDPVVSFDGITHVIIEDEEPAYKTAGALAKRRCAELSADALGLMYWHRTAGILTPLVYVPGADTLFWENSCGSGTAAVGAFLARQAGHSVTVSLRQAGGILTIAASPDGTLRLRGMVKCVYKRIAEVEI